MSGSSREKGARAALYLPLLPALIFRVASLRHYLTENPFARHLFSDGHHYREWAAAIAAGRAPLEPFYQAPLYPHFLALLFKAGAESPAAVCVVQLLIGLVSVHLVARIGLEFLRPFPAAAAAAAFGLLPYPVYFEHKLFPETISLVVALTALLIASRRRGAPRQDAAAGAAAGLAAAARANLLAFALLLPLPLFRGAPRRLAAYTAALALVLAPVAIWNAATGGGFLLVAANGGEVFCHGNNSNALGSMGKIAGLKADIESMAKRSVALASKESGRELSESGASRYWFGRGLRWIRENPAAWAHLELQKLRLALSARFTPLGAFYEFEEARFGGGGAFLRYLHYPLWLLALAGLLLRRKSAAPVPGAIALFAAAELATLLAFFVSTRYTVLLMPAVALYAGAGLEAILDRRRPWAILLIVAAGSAAAAWADRPPGGEWATPYAQLASILSDEGRGEEAVALYAEAARLEPMELIHHQNLAREKERLGDIDGARRAIEVPVRMGIADGRTLGYYGSLLVKREEWDRAERYLKEAVRVDPNRLLSRLLLGETYVRTGRWAEAEETFRGAHRVAPADPRPLRGLLALYEGPLGDPARAEEITIELENR